eukprot:TRINITY_DN1544_c0_g1_i2.p1 TRINITY_DN1544_c0_g1~~TRINITY_DN1544_c0_g1_i2.p1  ORF type:complete len:694 (+),score=127.27 TRINITY_DN1544_c0_g1_i2:2-2083(+)
MDRPPIEGYLLKQGDKGPVKLWRRRWFLEVPSEQKLYYYKDQSTANPNGFIDLALVEIVRHIQSHKNGFVVVCPGRLYNLAADTPESTNEWIRKFELIMEERMSHWENKLDENLLQLLPGERVKYSFSDTLLKNEDGDLEYSYTALLSNYRVLIVDENNISTCDYQEDEFSIPYSMIYKVDKSTYSRFEILKIVSKDVREFNIMWETGGHKRKYFLDCLEGCIPHTMMECFSYVYSQRDNSLGDTGNCGYYYYNVAKEYTRLGVPCINWKFTNVNKEYEICDTYPSLLVIPESWPEDNIIESSMFRTKRRFPVLSWKNKQNIALLRSSQPCMGITGQNSYHRLDEEYLDLLSVNGTESLCILDARARVAAMANRGRGAGTENKRYKNCKVEFLNIDNIHAVRASWRALSDLCIPRLLDSSGWLSSLEETKWLSHIRKILKGAALGVERIQTGLSILVHCSDGWDRTSQITSLIMILMDPYYRTLEGFILLIEKEWLSFGHKFSHRHGYFPGNDQEQSPIFLQFLECIWNITLMFPTEFHFNEDFLYVIYWHSYSGLYGTFLCDSEKERYEYLVNEKTASLWQYIMNGSSNYINTFYEPKREVLIPVIDMRKMTIWKKVFYRWNESLFISDHHSSMNTEMLKEYKRLKELESFLMKEGRTEDLGRVTQNLEDMEQEFGSKGNRISAWVSALPSE